MILTPDTYPSAEVLCDGAPVADCFYADTEKGEAKQYLRDHKGKFILGPSGNGVIWRWVRGKIEVKEGTLS